MYGAKSRCPSCNQYVPDRCICPGAVIAEVVSKFGDPEAFGERELTFNADAIQKLPYGTKLVIAPAAPVVAEGLEHALTAFGNLEFECGAWDDEHPDIGHASYEALVEKARAARDVVRRLATHPVAGSPAEAANFCPRCGKRLHPGSVHTCTPPAEPMPASEAAKQTLPQSECNAALRAAPAGQLEAEVAELRYELERANRHVEVLAYERDHARAKFDRVFKVMMSVYNLSPNVPDIHLPDGRVMRFVDPNATETLRALGEAIHAIPDELNKVDAARFRAEGGNTNGSTTNLAAPAAPTDAKALPDAIVQRTEAIRRGHSGNERSIRSRTRLLADVKELLGHIALLTPPTAAPSVRDAAQPIAPGKDKP